MVQFPIPKSPENVWKQVLDNLHVPEKVFRDWVRPVRPVELRDGRLRLLVPTEVYAKVLGTRYAQVLRAAAEQAGLPGLEFEFVVREAPGPESPSVEDVRQLLHEAGLSRAEVQDLLDRGGRLIRQGLPAERVLEAIVKPIRRLLARGGRQADPYALARHALELLRNEPAEAPLPPDLAGAIAYIERNFQRHCPVGTLDRRQTGRRQVLTFRFASEGIQATWTVQPGQHGLPGPFEVELWYALLIYTASLPKPIRNPVEVDLPALRNLLGWSKSGKSHRRILEALARLATTHYATHMAFHWRRSEDGVELVREGMFVLVQRIEKVEISSRRGSPTSRICIWLNECILDNLNRRHVAPLDAEFYSSLRRPVSKVLYVHLLPVLFAAEGPEVRIPYRALVTFTGLTEYRRPRDIRMQLKELFDELIRRGFVLGFDIESKGGGLVVLQKNPGFSYQVVRAPAEMVEKSSPDEDLGPKAITDLHRN